MAYKEMDYVKWCHIVKAKKKRREIGDKMDNLTIEIELADGLKCRRCWQYDKNTGYSPRYPGICPRCVQVLHEMRFPAYRLLEPSNPNSGAITEVEK